MGTDIENIQNAYKGFARGNYTMLDNLALGYAGTKEEMQRLLEDAQKLSGQKYDIDSYADIVDAIHAVQTEMGITGTTAAEAASTIQGSAGSVKAAWENLVTGLGDENADLDTLIGNLISSAETAAGNLLPTITRALSGMGQALEQLAPILAEEIPTLLTELLPSVVSAGAQLLVGLTTGLVGAAPNLVAALPELINTLMMAISASGPQLLESGQLLLSMLGDGIMNGIPALASAAAGVMDNLGEYLKENLPVLLQRGLEMLVSFTDMIRENAGIVVDGAVSLAKNLAKGLADSIPTIIENVPTIVSNIANVINDNAPKLLGAAAQMMGTLADGMIEAIPALVKNLPQILKAIWDVFTAFQWIDLGRTVIKSVGKGFSGAASFVKEQAAKIGDDLIGYFKSLPAKLKDIGENLINGLIEGVTARFEAIGSKITGIASKITGLFTSTWDVHSPSRVFYSIGAYLMDGLALGMEDSKGTVMETAEAIANELTSRYNAITDALTKKSKIADLQYQLWELTGGKGATDAEKYTVKLKKLTEQEVTQKATVEAAQTAYEEMAAQYGENSSEAMSYMQTLLQEQIEYAKLVDSIQEVIEAQRELASASSFSSSLSSSISTVDFASSGLGMSSAATVNALSSAAEAGQNVTLNATLVAPDGTKFANYYLPSFIKSAAANGTPIANPRMA